MERNYVTTADLAKRFACTEQNVRYHIRMVLPHEHQWHRMTEDEAARVAAVEMGYPCLGFESVADNVVIARQRIEALGKTPRLFSENPELSSVFNT